MIQPGIEPTTNKKMTKTAISRCAFPRPRLGGPVLDCAALSCGRGKYISIKIISFKNPPVLVPVLVVRIFVFSRNMQALGKLSVKADMTINTYSEIDDKQSTKFSLSLLRPLPKSGPLYIKEMK